MKIQNLIATTIFSLLFVMPAYSQVEPVSTPVHVTGGSLLVEGVQDGNPVAVQGDKDGTPLQVEGTVNVLQDPHFLDQRCRRQPVQDSAVGPPFTFFGLGQPDDLLVIEYISYFMAFEGIARSIVESLSIIDISTIVDGVTKSHYFAFPDNAIRPGANTMVQGTHLRLYHDADESLAVRVKFEPRGELTGSLGAASISGYVIRGYYTGACYDLGPSR